MNHHQIRGFEMAECVLQYLEIKPLPIPVARVSTLRARLEAVVQGARSFGAAQATGHRGYRSGSAERRHYVDALLQEMRDLNAIARAMDPDEFAGVSDLFRMPRSQAVAEIVAHALAFVGHARTMEAAFLERGRPAGFIAKMEEAIAAVEEAVGPKNRGLLARMAATSNLKDLLSHALAIRRELNAILTPLIREDPVALGSWKAAQHVERVTRRKRDHLAEVPTPVAAEEPARRLSPRLDQVASRDGQVNHIAEPEAEKPGPSVPRTDRS